MLQQTAIALATVATIFTTAIAPATAKPRTFNHQRCLKAAQEQLSADKKTTSDDEASKRWVISVESCDRQQCLETTRIRLDKLKKTLGAKETNNQWVIESKRCNSKGFRPDQSTPPQLTRPVGSY